MSHLGWDGRPWEVAEQQLAMGVNPYSENLRSRLVSVEQTGWPYGPVTLIALAPVYRLAVAASGGDPRPSGFPIACGVIAILAHLLLMREAWKLGGGGWRGALAALAIALNPFLIRLDGEGDILDGPMLWLLLAAVRAEEEGRLSRSGILLGLSIGVKQLGLLYLPVWLWRRRQAPVAIAALAAAVVLPALPFLYADPAGLLFALSGAASAYRNFVQLDFWNVFARELHFGVPPALLRAVSWVMTAGLLAAVTFGAGRARLRPLAALTLVLAGAWVTYYSAYSLYLGWWTVVASVFVMTAL